MRTATVVERQGKAARSLGRPLLKWCLGDGQIPHDWSFHHELQPKRAQEEMVSEVCTGMLVV